MRVCVCVCVCVHVCVCAGHGSAHRRQTPASPGTLGVPELHLPRRVRCHTRLTAVTTRQHTLHLGEKIKKIKKI